MPLETVGADGICNFVPSFFQAVNKTVVGNATAATAKTVSTKIATAAGVLGSCLPLAMIVGCKHKERVDAAEFARKQEKLEQFREAVCHYKDLVAQQNSEVMEWVMHIQNLISERNLVSKQPVCNKPQLFNSVAEDCEQLKVFNEEQANYPQCAERMRLPEQIEAVCQARVRHHELMSDLYRAVVSNLDITQRLYKQNSNNEIRGECINVK